ncbi:M14 family zinc carboxypeptidase [Allofustis seminis]|uniref:M14 family zinc carboxypeptidase n=1 Tax=Allofustis seminis TaxID=166939 RepID=UPI000361593F|nr:M14 family zinc carboxypeptidase [Allofustis seminis]
MQKKTVRYNKNYSLSLAMAALLIMTNADAVSAQEEVTTPVVDETAQVEPAHEAAQTPTEAPAEETPQAEAQTETVQPAAETTEAAQPAAQLPAHVPDNVSLSKQTIYMTEGGRVVIEAYVGDDAQVDDFAWMYQGKPLEEAQIWNKDTGKFDAGRLINFAQAPTIQNGVLRAKLDFGWLFGTQDLEDRYAAGGNLRRTFREYIGEYPLEIKNTKNGQVISKTIHMFPFEHYLSHDDLYKKINQVAEDAKQKTDRIVKVESYGKTVEGQDQLVGIIAKNEAVIDHYLNVTHPKMLQNPDELLELLKKGQFNEPIAVMVHNTHADEKPAPEIIVGLFEKFAKSDVIRYTTTDAEGHEVEVTYNVSDLLDRLILLFSFLENPDGHRDMKREHPSTGLDLNRDHGYQVLPETKNMVALINKWDPVSFFDIHGNMGSDPMLIEPCTKPHDRNFEADLIYPFAIEQAHAIGRAQLHNGGYQYIIPLLDRQDGWDDAFSGYTGVYAVYQGIFGHTVEINEMNERTYRAGMTGITAGLSHVYLNLDALLKAKLTIFSRGVNKIDAPTVNEWLVDNDGNGARPENFFPDYYVIPLSQDQRNIKGAYDMIEYFRRNGVKVSELKEDVGGYKKGDLVINMAQAKRGFANHVLSMGFDESVYGGMYAELVTNFPIMRGFDSYRVLIEAGKADPFAGLLGEVTHTSAPVHAPEKETNFYFIKNNSKDTILAINEAINAGKKVYAGKDGFYIDNDTYQTLKNKYSIAASSVDGNVDGQTLRPLKVFAPDSAPNYARIVYPSQSETVLKELGYQVVKDIEQADVVVMDSSNFDKKYLGVKPTIVLGGSAAVELSQIIDGLKASTTDRYFSHEGLLRVDVDKESLLSSGYLTDDYIYTNEATWIDDVPEGFKVLIRVKDSDDFYVSGWWPGHDAARGKAMGIVGTYNDVPLFIYAGTPVNKFHTQSFYRWLNNAIALQGVEEATITPVKPEEPKPTTPKEETNKEGKEENKKLKVTEASLLPKSGEDSPSLLAGVMSLLGGLGLFAAVDNKKRKAAKK